MTAVPEKFRPAELPKTRAEAEAMLSERRALAELCRSQDKNGSAREFELTVLLLEKYAETLA